MTAKKTAAKRTTARKRAAPKPAERDPATSQDVQIPTDRPGRLDFAGRCDCGRVRYANSTKCRACLANEERDADRAG